MLIQFSVKNFMSFREKAVLALNPSVDTEHPENIITIGEHRAANVMAIYGANASGKTSLFKAMSVALWLIRNSNIMQVNQQIPFIVPFKFNEQSVGEPSEFEFVFVADDGVRYVYGFSADRMNIKEEYLYQYKSQRPTLIFEREDEKYVFKSQKKLLEPLVRFNTHNKLFLATATNWNTECTIIPYRWFTEHMTGFTDPQLLTELSISLYKSSRQAEYVKFTEDLLQAADVNISKIRIDVKKIKVGKPVGGYYGPQQISINGQQLQLAGSPEVEQFEMRTEHVINSDNGQSKYMLGIGEESLGTNQIVVLAPFFKDAFDKGVTVVIDEIDKSLHPFIVKYIINLFRDESINKTGAQLLFTTHDTSLLSLSTFRRDQIYFTEKNNSTGESELYSLDEFPVRKTENIEKGYLLGRYGAIPYIRGEEL